MKLATLLGILHSEVEDRLFVAEELMQYCKDTEDAVGLIYNTALKDAYKDMEWLIKDCFEEYVEKVQNKTAL